MSEEAAAISRDDNSLDFLVALGLGAGSLFVPESAAAHIANYNYKFPLPLWVLLTGGALAVLASAPAAAFAVEAHRVSLRLHRRPRNALLAQTPLILLMVGYTLAGLWVLRTSISGG